MIYTELEIYSFSSKRGVSLLPIVSRGEYNYLIGREIMFKSAFIYIYIFEQ